VEDHYLVYYRSMCDNKRISSTSIQAIFQNHHFYHKYSMVNLNLPYQGFVELQQLTLSSFLCVSD